MYAAQLTIVIIDYPFAGMQIKYLPPTRRRLSMVVSVWSWVLFLATGYR